MVKINLEKRMMITQQIHHRRSPNSQIRSAVMYSCVRERAMVRIGRHHGRVNGDGSMVDLIDRVRDILERS
jgi:hypothetical protein